LYAFLFPNSKPNQQHHKKINKMKSDLEQQQNDIATAVPVTRAETEDKAGSGWNKNKVFRWVVLFCIVTNITVFIAIQTQSSNEERPPVQFAWLPVNKSCDPTYTYWPDAPNKTFDRNRPAEVETECMDYCIFHNCRYFVVNYIERWDGVFPYCRMLYFCVHTYEHENTLSFKRIN
jgi:hypothetical protein